MLLELGMVVTVKIYRNIPGNVCFLLWVLVAQICSDCENLVSFIPMICVLLSMYLVLQFKNKTNTVKQRYF